MKQHHQVARVEFIEFILFFSTMIIDIFVQLLGISGHSVSEPVYHLNKGHETEAKAQSPESTNLDQNDISLGEVVLH